MERKIERFCLCTTMLKMPRICMWRSKSNCRSRVSHVFSSHSFLAWLDRLPNAIDSVVHKFPMTIIDSPTPFSRVTLLRAFLAVSMPSACFHLQTNVDTLETFWMSHFVELVEDAAPEKRSLSVCEKFGLK
jgi:hypothetical protein